MLIVWNCAHCGASQFEQKSESTKFATNQLLEQLGAVVDEIDSAVKYCTCCRERHIHNGAPLLLLSSERKRFARR